MLPIHRLLSGKYFVDELYDRVIVQPLAWCSEVVLLRGGDKMLLDGSLNGLASLAQRTAGLLGRAQTGSLHLYALLVMVGLVGALLWSWRHV
jgi:NADH-quinone oxidoreductase subunit L